MLHQAWRRRERPCWPSRLRAVPTSRLRGLLVILREVIRARRTRRRPDVFRVWVLSAASLYVHELLVMPGVLANTRTIVSVVDVGCKREFGLTKRARER